MFQYFSEHLVRLCGKFVRRTVIVYHIISLGQIQMLILNSLHNRRSITSISVTSSCNPDIFIGIHHHRHIIRPCKKGLVQCNRGFHAHKRPVSGITAPRVPARHMLTLINEILQHRRMHDTLQLLKFAPVSEHQ